MNRSAATFDRERSPTSICASSNKRATKREGIARAPGGAGLELLAASPAESEIAYDVESGGKGIASPRVTSFSALPGVTTEKCVMNCNLPSCLIWKSSLCRFSTAWPVESCTTTRTGTRFARDSSGTGEVRVLISGVEAAVVETGSAEAGAVADGAVNCAADD